VGDSSRLRLLAACALALAVLSLPLTGCKPSAATQGPQPGMASAPVSNTANTGGGRLVAMPKGLEKIDHFVFIMQENRKIGRAHV
jgi:hypothetical protein